MSFSKQETPNTGSCSSTSLENPCKEAERNKVCKSVPFIKPNMAKLKDQVIQKILTTLNRLKDQNDPQLTDFSIDESKMLLKDLANQLNRHLQLKCLIDMSKVSKGKLDESECQRLFRHWAEELQSHQSRNNPENIQNQTQILENENMFPDQETCKKQDKKTNVNKTNTILSKWICNLQNSPEGSLMLGENSKAVLQEMYKQWKKGYLATLLPLMDFTIRCMLHRNESKGSVHKHWLRCNQMFKKTGGLPIPTQVWSFITESSANVILDPATANPTLLLSENGRALKTKTHEEVKSDESRDSHRTHKNQYDSWTCVQAKKGYSTGRHYWVVNVKDKCDWRIGVVTESAQRNGFVQMNTSKGYWTLRLQLGSLMALTQPVTKLNQPTPSIIGVHLNVEGGEVSFYDAMLRKHIYTFTAKFEKCEKIYPVFGTVETDIALRIL